jgi:hypothetical protein
MFVAIFTALQMKISTRQVEGAGKQGRGGRVILRIEETICAIRCRGEDHVRAISKQAC